MENIENTAPTEPTALHIVRAVTNDPTLAERQVTLGDRVFPVLDLPYDQYILFLAELRPLLEGLMGTIPGLKDLSVVGALTPAALVTYCGNSLPRMAQIVCVQSDPDITVDDVKRLGKTPFKLASVVLAQVEQNAIIADIKAFFVQLAPLLRKKS